MKLKGRLLALAQMVPGEVDKIADLCCDHGKLGEYLGLQKEGRFVHLVDIKNEIISGLEERLKKDYILDTQIPGASLFLLPNKAKLKTTIADVSKENIESDYYIITGIGGHLMVKILKNLNSNHASFLLCPHQNTEVVIEWLRNNEYRLQSEQLIYERGKFYRTLSVSKNGIYGLETYGSLMFQDKTPLIKKYIQQQIGHFEALSSFKDVEAQLNFFKSML